MGRVFLYSLSTIGALAVLVAVLGATWLIGQRREALPAHLILELDLSEGLTEYIPDDPLAKLLSAGQPTVAGTIEALDRAARDDRVVALIARVGTGFGYPAKVQELRDAVLEFRKSGKRAVAWVETFGVGNRGTINYYLATAFDEIQLLPLGSVTFTGLSMEAPFIAGALDKLASSPAWTAARSTSRRRTPSPIPSSRSRTESPTHGSPSLTSTGSRRTSLPRGGSAGNKLTSSRLATRSAAIRRWPQA